MAVHVPLSAEAQAEARFLMLSANNLLHPKDGRPVNVPTQDMVLGTYYLTLERDDVQGTGNVYSCPEEALMAYDAGALNIHAAIKVRREGIFGGKNVQNMVDCTVGRILFNEAIPQDLGFVDRTHVDRALDYEVTFVCGKNDLSRIIERCINRKGFTESAILLDHIKTMGFRYSTQGAMTVSISDMVVPPEKKKYIEESEKKVADIDELYRQGMITNDERYRLVVKEWEETTDKVTTALQDSLTKYNPIKMMADSGARGSMKQMRQLAGMRGLMANTAGRTIEVPIKSNFREGLSVLEYFISSRGARKGLADTALRTADSGYLTRRLVDVSQDVIIREKDCGTDKGINVSEIAIGNQIIEPLVDRLESRYTIDSIKDAKGKVLLAKNSLISSEIARRLVKNGVTAAHLRSPLACRARHGVCAKCYGANLATGEEINVGEAVGIIAAQSIGEPGTQLTMRTFHTGGVAGDDITQGLPRVEELFEARKPKRAATLSEIAGVVSMEEAKRGTIKVVTVRNNETGDARIYQIPSSNHFRVSEGQKVEVGSRFTDGALNPHDVLSILGVEAVQNYLIQEVQHVYRQQGVDINDKHIEVIVRQMMRKVKIENTGDTDLLLGATVDIFELEAANKALKERAKTGDEELHPAEGSTVLLGITKASLATDSFLSAASFQETTRVLTEAAIKGKVDNLLGLKENVIIGKLVPAGSGMDDYRNFEVEYRAGYYTE
jgi:DNA-directed RNA polymerase subunit beta'